VDGRLDLFAQDPGAARFVRGQELYVRLSADEDRPRSELETPDSGFDAVSVTWLDSLSDFEALRAEPTYPELVAAELKLRSPEVAAVVTAAPDIIVGPAGGVPESQMSLICILAHKPELSLPEFHEHWLKTHGGLFQNIPELHDPLWGYEQNHGIPVAGFDYDGVTQQWFPSLAAWTASLEAPAHADIVFPDMRSFLDQDSIHFILAGPPRVVRQG
jgi:EthD domain